MNYIKMKVQKPGLMDFSFFIPEKECYKVLREVREIVINTLPPDWDDLTYKQQREYEITPFTVKMKRARVDTDKLHYRRGGVKTKLNELYQYALLELANVKTKVLQAA